MTNLQVFLDNNGNLLLVYQVFEILPNRITLNTYMTMSFTRFHNLSCHLKMEKLHFRNHTLNTQIKVLLIFILLNFVQDLKYEHEN